MIWERMGKIVERPGTPNFAFKDIDENRPAGAIRLRLETLDYALGRHRERLIQRRRAAERIERVLARYEQRLRAGLRPPWAGEAARCHGPRAGPSVIEKAPPP